MEPPESMPPAADRVGIDVIGLLSRKWHPVVLVTLQEREPLGFNELLESIPEVSGKVLSGALEELGEVGLVNRTVINESPLRVQYGLTQAGREMESVFDALDEWGERHLETATATVLLADGDPRITEMFESWLSDRYAVVRAHDGDAVRDHLLDPPDVLLVERGLPGADTAALVEEVKPQCRVVLLLGKRPDLDLLDVGCDDVLQKPVVRDTALETIEAQLQREEESTEERERAALAAKCSFLESVYPRDLLERSIEYFEASYRTAPLEELPEN